MSKLYFIDHESIKKTAKAIKKQNEKHNYTYILDELTKCLGYTSYNNYEHYLTNAFLNSQSNLKKLIPLTQLTITELSELNNYILNRLSDLKISANSLYFLEKVIKNKTISFKGHKHLSLTSYLYYLPFIFDSNERIIYGTHINKEEFIELIKTMKSYYFNSPFIHFKNNKYFLNASKQELEKAANDDLKNRSLYYLALSIEEGIIYGESILIKSLLNNDNDDQLYEELQHALAYFNKNKKTIREIPNFSSYTNKQDYNLLFPYIKNHVSNEKPLILGVDNNESPVFFNRDEIFKNIFMCGRPGSGLNTIKQTFTLQTLMNNRGFLNIDCQPQYSINKTFEERRIEYIGVLFNKQDDVFLYNSDDVNLLYRSINNNKIINYNLLEGPHLYNDIKSEALNKLLIVLETICNNYYNASFRKNSFPYYIFIDNYAGNKLNDSIYSAIKNLNNIGIYTVFTSLFSSPYNIDSYNEIFENFIITNGDVKTTIENNQIFTGGPSPYDLIGESGPSRLGVGFSHYAKMKFKQEFWVKPTSNYTDFETAIRESE